MKTKTELQSDLDELQKQLYTRQQALLLSDGQYQFLAGKIVQIQEIIGEPEPTPKKAKADANAG